MLSLTEYQRIIMKDSSHTSMESASSFCSTCSASFFRKVLAAPGVWKRLHHRQDRQKQLKKQKTKIRKRKTKRSRSKKDKRTRKRRNLMWKLRWLHESVKPHRMIKVMVAFSSGWAQLHSVWEQWSTMDWNLERSSKFYQLRHVIKFLRE